MLNTAFRILGSQEEAEDVLQESFVSAFRNIASYREEATFGAWLKRIVVNKALTSVKKRKLEYVEVDQAAGLPEEILEYQEDQLHVQKIKEAMMKLPDGFRTVFSLYLIEGYDHKEIGQILGISESTSKSQLNRAKVKVRELLNQEVYE